MREIFNIVTVFQAGLPYMPKRFFYFFCCALMAVVFVPRAPQAEQMNFSNLSYPAYAIDEAIESCNKNLKRFEYVVLAYSSGGAMMCVYGDQELRKSSREIALKTCNQNRTDVEARLTKCRLVMENGKVIDRKFYASQRRDARTPMDIEIYDGKTKKLSRTTGFLSSGRLLSHTLIELKLTTSGGAVLCKGVMRYLEFSATFKTTCFDKYVFSGPVPKSAGFMMYEGQLVQRLTVKVKHEKSYISIKPRI